MNEGRYRLDDFELYNAARAFRKKTYSLARQLPELERYVLNPQIRRAAISVSNNIAEGHGRWHYQENDRKLITELRGDAYRLIGRVNSYIKYLNSNQQRAGATD